MSLVGRYVNDRYRVLQKVGEGGMGEVFAAEDVVADRLVALKVMRRELGDPAAAQRFLREAQALARLRSRNIVQIFDFQRDMNLRILFVAMELAVGDDLSRIIACGRLRPALALAALEEAASGLEVAHAAAIVHRDLKPANLKLRPRSNGSLRVKLLDFGLVRDRTMDADITDVGMAPGTVTYISPEVLSGERADARSDLYSLGIVAHEMLTGRPPFTGGTPVVVAKRHREESPAPIGSLVPEPLPSGLEELVLDLLAKDPRDRVSGAAELRSRARAIREAAGLQVVLDHTGASHDPVTDWQLLPHLGGP